MKPSFFKFLTMTVTNIVFLIIGLGLGFGTFGYGLYNMFIHEYTFGIIMCVGSLIWLIGYRYRLRTDYKAYLSKLEY